MKILLDTSALVKRYALEPGRDRVLALSDAASELCVAAHCKIEVLSVLRLLQCEGSLDMPNLERAWQRVEQEFAEMSVVPLSAVVESHAAAAVLQTPMRGGTALHIGSAQAARVDLFVTADPHQADAAMRHGLATELIES